MLKKIINLLQKNNDTKGDVVLLTDVFNTSDKVSYSYVSRSIKIKDILEDKDIEITLEEKIEKDIVRNKLIILHGYTKQGKTILVKNIFSNKNHIWISGGSHSNAQAIWSEINLHFGIASSFEQGESQSKGAKKEIKHGSKVGLYGWFGIRQSFSNSQEANNTKNSKEIFNLEPKVSAAKVLKDSKVSLVIDDFHFIDKESQTEIINFVRSTSSPIILITTSSHIYDAVSAHDEVSGRIEYIELPKWTDEDLKNIVIFGLTRLNIKFDDSIVSMIVKNSFHSPFLTQEICYALCYGNKFLDSKESKQLTLPSDTLYFLKQISEGFQTETYKAILKINNHAVNTYHLKDGKESDIYQIIRIAIASYQFFPTILVSDIISKVSSLLNDSSELKNPHSQVPQSLKNFATVADERNKMVENKQNKKSESALEYIKNDSGSDCIVFHDPMLALYLITHQ